MNISIRKANTAFGWLLSIATSLPLGGLGWALGGGLLASCSDWDDHYDGASASGSDLTLWQTMQQQQRLSDFCEVLEQTKVFRQHRKTATSYADLLKGGQSFTVLAPVNGTFNKDSLLRLVQTAQGDSTVERTFVLNHLSRSNVSATGETVQMRLANGKRIGIGQGKVGTVGIAEANLHTHNGTLHVMQGRVPYNLSLYEAMTDLPQFGLIGAFLRSYEEDDFDENASLSSGMVDGVPVYVDSVVNERNRFLEKVALLAAEDSTYLMVAPSTAGWQAAYDEALQYFVYDATTDKRDSIQQYWTHRALLDDAVFSLTVQASPQDSLVSPQYDRKHPKYHVFYHPFAQGGILSQGTALTCSNGTLYQTDAWPFTPQQTYFQELRSEGEDVELITDYSQCNYTKRTFAADSVSENAYLDINPATGTANWNMTFKVENTLSGSYDVCAIILPKSVLNPLDPDLRPCKFKATVNYVDEEGLAQSYDCGGATFRSNPLRVDTVVLAQGFHFPTCNYDQVNNKVSVRLSCSILARETSSYARQMYLDCIYLRPTSSDLNKE